MNKDKFLQTGLLEQYVLGLTDEEEAAIVEEYAERYPEVQDEIQKMREALDQYAQEYAVMPPEELKSRVMKGIDEAEAHSDTENSQPGPSARSSMFGDWGLIALLGALGLCIFLYRGKASAEQSLQHMTMRFEALQSECAEEKAALRRQSELYAILQHEATLPVRIEPQGDAYNAEAVAYLNPLEKVAYINTGLLPPPPPGKDYQLWADVDGEMINMGVIDLAHEGLQAVNFIEHAESLNITLEPEGGSQAPTVAMLVGYGKVS